MGANMGILPRTEEIDTIRRCFVSLLFFQIHMLKYSSILSLSLL